MPLQRITCCYIIPDKCYIVTLTGDALSGQRLTVQLVGTWCMGTYNLPTSIAQFPIWRALLFSHFNFILSSRAYQFVKIGEEKNLALNFTSIEYVSLREKRKENEKITVCQDGHGCSGVLRWISFLLNSLIHWASKRDNFIFATPTFIIWYFCFPRKVCNMIPLFSQKTYKGSFLRYARFFSCWRVMK